MSAPPVLSVGPQSAAIVRALGILYLVGASLAVACVLLPNSPLADETAIWITIAVAYAAVPVLFTQYRRLSTNSISGVIALATALITSVAYFDHTATTYYPWFYLWVTPYAAIFFSGRHVAGHVAFVGLCYGIVLAVHAGDGNGAPGGAEIGHWLHAMLALGVTILLVRALTRALSDSVATAEAERRRRALEINDDVVQRLVIARQAYAADERAEGDAAVDAALGRARAIMADLVGGEDATPGSLRRESRATVD